MLSSDWPVNKNIEISNQTENRSTLARAPAAQEKHKKAEQYIHLLLFPHLQRNDEMVV